MFHDVLFWQIYVTYIYVYMLNHIFEIRTYCYHWFFLALSLQSLLCGPRELSVVSGLGVAPEHSGSFAPNINPRILPKTNPQSVLSKISTQQKPSCQKFNPRFCLRDLKQICLIHSCSLSPLTHNPSLIPDYSPTQGLFTRHFDKYLALLSSLILAVCLATHISLISDFYPTKTLLSKELKVLFRTWLLHKKVSH